MNPIVHPAIGNHEYQTPNASGYFDYFNGVGQQTGKAGDRATGHYSFDLGTWHLIALNSNCSIVSCSASSPQEAWLRSDLAGHSAACTVAYWHHPLFNSGIAGNATNMRPIFQDLYNANSDLVLSGHDHHYERFAPENPSGQADGSRGIREIIVGTGGNSLFDPPAQSPQPNSEVRDYTTFGVLELALHPTSYDWLFIPASGGAFTDSGTQSCH
jgi:acid phosphatase type 7